MKVKNVKKRDDNGVFNKVKFINPEEPIEIFCTQKYKNYYIRGQIIEFCDGIYNESLPKGYDNACYHLKVIVLMKEDCRASAPVRLQNYMQFGIFLGRTEEEFKNIQQEFELDIIKQTHENQDIPIKDALNDSLEDKNPPWVVDIKNININTTPYLTTSIQNNKDIILLEMEVSLNRVMHHYKFSSAPDCLNRIHQLLGYNFVYENQEANLIILCLFEDLYNILRLNLGYNYTSKDEYCDLLCAVGELSNEWITKRSVTKAYKQRLNKFIHSIKDRSQPFYDFCYKFFDNLIDELKEYKVVSQCSVCGDVIQFRHDKQYCSLKTDGKECGTKARNKRYYLAHKGEILPRARKYSREYRKFDPHSSTNE